VNNPCQFIKIVQALPDKRTEQRQRLKHNAFADTARWRGYI